MLTSIGTITVQVTDQDKALEFYTKKLGFEKRTDQTFGPGWRWLTIAPKDQKELEITLMKPDAAMFGEEKAKALAEQIGMAPPGRML